MDEYKSVKKYIQKTSSKLPKDNLLKHYFISLISRLLIVVVLFLIVLIACKNPTFKGYINEYVYNTNINFSSIKKWYQNNLGDIIPINADLTITEPVFSENLIYQSSNIYKDGVSLKVGSNYLVPVLESGIIVFIGDKEEYGKTVIIQQVNGVDLWYSNINFQDLKLYDYVEKGSLLGEAIEDSIYLVFQKEGKYLDYKEYLQ